MNVQADGDSRVVYKREVGLFYKGELCSKEKFKEKDVFIYLDEASGWWCGPEGGQETCEMYIRWVATWPGLLIPAALQLHPPPSLFAEFAL